MLHPVHHELAGLRRLAPYPADHAASLDHVGLLLVQTRLDVERVPDVELAVFPDLGLRVAVHAARRRSPDPAPVDVVEPAVAGAQVELLVAHPPHGAPQVRAGVGEHVELAHDLLALRFRKTGCLLIQYRGPFRLPDDVAVRTLTALLLDGGLPREPDGVRELVPRSRLAGVGEFLLYGPLPVGLLQGKFDLEVRGLLHADVGDGGHLHPSRAHIRLAENVRLDDGAQHERHGRYRQDGPDYGAHHPEAEKVSPGHGIFLQLYHASPLLEPRGPQLTGRTPSAGDPVLQCIRADYIPCKAPRNWTS